MLILEPDGTLIDTGEVVVPTGPVSNLTCAPDGQTALALAFDATVTSLAIPGLAVLDQVTVPGTEAASAQFKPAGDRVYLRSDTETGAWEYDPETGQFADLPLWSAPSTASFIGGIDTLAFDHRRGRVFTTSADLTSYDARDGSVLSSVPSGLRTFTGICLPQTEFFFSDGFESGGTGRWSVVAP